MKGVLDQKVTVKTVYQVVAWMLAGCYACLAAAALLQHF